MNSKNENNCYCRNIQELENAIRNAKKSNNLRELNKIKSKILNSDCIECKRLLAKLLVER